MLAITSVLSVSYSLTAPSRGAVRMMATPAVDKAAEGVRSCGF